MFLTALVEISDGGSDSLMGILIFFLCLAALRHLPMLRRRPRLLYFALIAVSAVETRGFPVTGADSESTSGSRAGGWYEGNHPACRTLFGIPPLPT
jgi:hypothetical protein